MLVLSRRLNEEIEILDEDGNVSLEIMVTRLKKNEARLGIKFNDDKLKVRRKRVAK